MKIYAFNEITAMQYIWLISGMQVSVGFLALPQKLSEKAGTDSWIALIFGWAVAVAASLAIVQVMKKHPDFTLPDLLTYYWGKWLGKAATIALALYFGYIAYACLFLAVLITKVWLLPQTPMFISLLLLLLPTYVIVRNGPRVLGRYAELVVYTSLWILAVYLLPLKDAHWLHLLPLAKEGWSPIFSAVPTTFYFFVGFGSTYIWYPFLQNKRKASACIVIANTLTLLAFLLILVVCLVFFSPDEITEFHDPAVNVVKAIEFKFVERIEVLIIVFYLFIYSLSWMPAMYETVFCTSKLFGMQDHRLHLRLLCLFIAVGSYFYMPTFYQTDRMNDVLGRTGFGLEYIFPVCLLVYLWIHDRIKRRQNA